MVLIATPSLSLPVVRKVMMRTAWARRGSNPSVRLKPFSVELSRRRVRDVCAVAYAFLRLNVLLVSEDHVDIQAFVAGDSAAVIVAFRGTEPRKPADIITDATFALGPGGWGTGNMHPGFGRALNAIWPDLLASIDGLRTKSQSLWFTGHSLGGALAFLAGVRLVAKRPNTIGRGVHTFGQPRVADAAFADWCKPRLREAAFRYINNRDVVTRVPTRLNGYHESGEVLYFDERGVLRSNSDFWFRFLDTVVVTREAVRAKAKEGIADHDIAAYAELLRIAADIPDRAL